MDTPDFAGATWRKSSRSGDNGGQCVEVAFVGDAVGLRDSKANGADVVLAFTPGEWTAFVVGVGDSPVSCAQLDCVETAPLAHGGKAVP